MVLRWTPSSRAMRRWRHPFRCRQRIASCKLTLRTLDMPQSKRLDALRRSRFRPSKVVHFEPGYFERRWYTLTDRRHLSEKNTLGGPREAFSLWSSGCRNLAPLGRLWISLVLCNCIVYLSTLNFLQCLRIDSKIQASSGRKMASHSCLMNSD
jgi:hypothetical protein